MVTLNTNHSSLFARAKHREATSELSKSIERLSSGLRVNSAADDAAGQAIANRMEVNLRANRVTTRNVSDGISLAQTAEGGLDAINSLVQRARELAVQAANGSLSTQDRASIHGEFEYMAYIPKGATNLVLRINSLGLDDDIQLFTRDGKHLIGTPMLGTGTGTGTDPDHVWVSRGVTDAATAEQHVLTIANGFLAEAAYSADHLLDVTDQFDPAIPFTPLDPNSGYTTVYQDADGDMILADKQTYPSRCVTPIALPESHMPF